MFFCIVRLAHFYCGKLAAFSNCLGVRVLRFEYPDVLLFPLWYFLLFIPEDWIFVYLTFSCIVRSAHSYSGFFAELLILLHLFAVECIGYFFCVSIDLPVRSAKYSRAVVFAD